MESPHRRPVSNHIITLAVKKMEVKTAGQAKAQAAFGAAMTGSIGTAPLSPTGIANAARVSYGSEHDVWSGLTGYAKTPVRHESEHLLTALYNSRHFLSALVDSRQGNSRQGKARWPVAVAWFSEDHICRGLSQSRALTMKVERSKTARPKCHFQRFQSLSTEALTRSRASRSEKANRRQHALAREVAR